MSKDKKLNKKQEGGDTNDPTRTGFSIRQKGDNLSITEDFTVDKGTYLNPAQALLLDQSGSNSALPEFEDIEKSQETGRDFTFGMGEGLMKRVRSDDMGVIGRTGGLLSYQGIDERTFDKYESKGIDVQPEVNAYRQLAQKQTFMQQLGTAFNPIGTGAKIGLGIIENVGYIGELVFGDGDYDNALTRFAQGGREWYKDTMPTWLGGGEILQLNPSQTWGVGDSGWWLSHGEGLIESIGEFFATGFGVGSALGKGASLLAKGTAASARATKLLKGAAQVGTSGTLAYTEGAMTGAQVFKKIYKEHRDKGRTDEDSRKAAAAGAATAVHLNTTVNTFLNLGSVAPLFRSAKTTRNALTAAQRKAFQKLPTEGLEQYEKRILKLNADAGVKPKTGAAAVLNFLNPGTVMLREAGMEGLEELTNVWAEKSGERVGRSYFTTIEDAKADAKARGVKYSDASVLATYFSRLEQLGHYWDDTMNSEGLLNFTLGAVGGMGQTGIMRNVPFQKVAERYQTGENLPEGVKVGDEKRDSNGNVIYKRRSARKQDKLEEQRAFNKIKLDLVQDIEFVNKRLDKLKRISMDDTLTEQEKEVESNRVKDELYSAESYRAIRGGWSQALQGTFESILNADNTKPATEMLEAQLKSDQALLENLMQDPENNADAIKRVTAKIKGIETLIATGATEAMALGLTDKVGDDSYKKKAQEAIEDLKHYEKLYQDFMYKYDYGDGKTERAAKTLFETYTVVRQKEKQLKALDEQIKNAKEESEKVLSEYGDNLGRMQQALELAQELEAKEHARKKIVEEMDKTLKGVKLEQKLEELKRTYPTLYVKLRKEHGDDFKTINDKLFEQYFKDMVNQVNELDESSSEIAKKQSALLMGMASDKLVEENAKREAEGLPPLALTVDALAPHEDLLKKQIQAARDQLNENIQDAYNNTAEVREQLKNLRKHFAALNSAKGQIAFQNAYEAFAKEFFKEVGDEVKTQMTPEEDKEEEVVDETDTVGPRESTDKYEKGFKHTSKTMKEKQVIHEFLNSLPKDTAISLKSFLDKFLLAKDKDGNRIPALDLHMDMFLKLAETPNIDGDTVKVKIIREHPKGKRNPAYYNSEEHTIYIVTRNFWTGHYEAFSRIMVHEAVHAMLVDDLTKDTESYKKVQELIMSLDPSPTKATTFVGALNNILEDLKTQIDNATDPKVENHLKGVYSAFKYMKETEAYGSGVEEFITQTFEENSDLAAYLHSIPHTDAETSGPAPKMSVWQYLKQMLLDVVQKITGTTKLQELSNILDSFVDFKMTVTLSPTRDGLVDPGVYTREDGREFIILNINDGIIDYIPAEQLSTDDKTTLQMTTSGFLRLLENDRIDSLNVQTADQFIADFVTPATLDNNLLEEARKLLNDTTSLIPYLSSIELSRLVKAIDAKQKELEKDEGSLDVSAMIDEINNASSVEKVNEILTSAFVGDGAIEDMVEKARLLDAASAKIDELVKDDAENNGELGEMLDIPGNILQGMANLPNNDENSFDLFIDKVYEGLEKGIQKFKTYLSLVEADETATDPKDSISMAKGLHEFYKEQLRSFYQEVQEKANKLRKEFKEGTFENERLKEMVTAEAIAAKVRSGIATLDALLIDTLQRIDGGDRYVQIIDKKDGRNIEDGGKNNFDVKKNAKGVDYKAFYKVVGEDADTVDLVMHGKDETKEENILRGVPKEDVHFFQDSKNFIGAKQENVYYPEYIYRMFMKQLNMKQEIPLDILVIGFKQAAVQMYNLVETLNEEKDSKRLEAALDEISRNIKVWFEFRESVSDSQNARYQAGIVMNKIKKLVKAGEEITEEQYLEWATKLYNLGYHGNYSEGTRINMQAIVLAKMKDLLAKGIPPTDIGKFMRFRINTKVSVEGNKAIEEGLGVSEDNIAKDKLRTGILKANAEKIASGEDFIGVHKWENIDITVELNFGTEENPSWMQVGSPNNPKVFRKVNADQTNIPEVYHPGIIWNEYSSTPDPMLKEQLLEQFNRLYAQNDGVTFDEAALKRFGEAFNNMEAMWDTLIELYNNSGQDDIILGPEVLAKMFDFDVTPGSINFRRRVKDEKNTLKDVSEESSFQIEDKVVIVDAYEQITKPAREGIITEEAEIYGEFSRFLSEDVEDMLLKNPDLVSEIEELDLPKKENRYWVIVKDIQGNLRPIALKPRNLSQEEIGAFLNDLRDITEKANKGLITGNAKLVDEEGKFTEAYLKVLTSFDKALRGQYSSSKSGAYIKISPAVFGGAVNISIFPTFYTKDGKKTNNINPNSVTIRIQQVSQGPTPKVISKEFNDLDITSVESFIASLKGTGMFTGNIGIHIPDAKFPTFQDAAEYFEIPTKREPFRGHNIIMTPKPFTVDDIKDGIETYEEPKEQTLEEKRQEALDNADLFHGTATRTNVLKGEFDMEYAFSGSGNAVGAGLYLTKDPTKAQGFAETAVQQRETKGLDFEGPEILYFNSSDFNLLKSGEPIGLELAEKIKAKYPDTKITEDLDAKDLFRALVQDVLGVPFTASLYTGDMIPIMLELGIDGIDDGVQVVLYNFEKIKDNEINNRFDQLAKEETGKEKKDGNKEFKHGDHLVDGKIDTDPIKAQLEVGQVVKFEINGKKYTGVFNGDMIIEQSRTNSRGNKDVKGKFNPWGITDILALTDGKITTTDDIDLEFVEESKKRRPSLRDDLELWEYIKKQRIFLPGMENFTEKQKKSKVNKFRELRQEIIDKITEEGKIEKAYIEKLLDESIDSEANNEKYISKFLRKLDIRSFDINNKKKKDIKIVEDNKSLYEEVTPVSEELSEAQEQLIEELENIFKEAFVDENNATMRMLKGYKNNKSTEEYIKKTISSIPKIPNNDLKKEAEQIVKEFNDFKNELDSTEETTGETIEESFNSLLLEGVKTKEGANRINQWIFDNLKEGDRIYDSDNEGYYQIDSKKTMKSGNVRLNYTYYVADESGNFVADDAGFIQDTKGNGIINPKKSKSMTLATRPVGGEIEYSRLVTSDQIKDTTTEETVEETTLTDIEEKREKELMQFLSEENKMFASKIKDLRRRYKFVKTRAGKVAGGNNLLNIYKAEDVLADPNSTVEERTVARYSIQKGGLEFNAAIGEFNRLKEEVKSDYKAGMSDISREYKKIYDAELAALETTTKKATSKQEIARQIKNFPKKPGVLQQAKQWFLVANEEFFQRKLKELRDNGPAGTDFTNVDFRTANMILDVYLKELDEGITTDKDVDNAESNVETEVLDELAPLFNVTDNNFVSFRSSFINRFQDAILENMEDELGIFLGNLPPLESEEDMNEYKRYFLEGDEKNDVLPFWKFLEEEEVRNEVIEFLSAEDKKDEINLTSEDLENVFKKLNGC